MSLTQHPSLGDLQRFLVGALPPALDVSTEGHLGSCPRCQMRARLLARDVSGSGEPAVVGNLRALRARLEQGLGRYPGDPVGRHPAWDNTGLIAFALRGTMRSAPQPAAASFVLAATLSSLEHALGSGSGFGSSLDEAWLVLEHLEEASIPIVTAAGGRLAVEFADLYSALAADVTSPAVKCALVWGVQELVERGRHSKAMGALVASRLSGCDDGPIQGTLGALLHLRGEDLSVLPEAQRQSIREASSKVIVPMLASVDEFAHRIAPIGRQKVVKGVDTLLRGLEPLILEITRPEPLDVVLGLAGLKLALRHTMRRIERTPALLQPSLEAMCEALFVPPSHDPQRVIFPCVEAAEAIRDAYPGRCATIMAGLLPRVDDRVRQGLFLCLAEGFEEKYGGSTQSRTPTFRPARNGRRLYDSPNRGPLDRFGRLVTSSQVPNLDPFMDWFNRRLAHWRGR